MVDLVKVEEGLTSAHPDLCSGVQSCIIERGGVVPRKSSDSQETYGEWLARAPDHELSSAELRERRARQAWEREHRNRVARLERCIGKTYVLRESMGTVACDMAASVDERIERGVYEDECDADLAKSVMGWPAGTRLRVFARSGDRLLARTDTEIVLSLVPEWLRLVSSERVEPKTVKMPKKAPEPIVVQEKTPTIRPPMVSVRERDFLMAPMPKRRRDWGQTAIALSL